MRMVDLIEKKRDGEELATEEINFIIEGYNKGKIPDYQMGAFVMAVFFRGMTERELAALTMAMVYSGDTVNLSAISGVKVDKHSTGGVGDTTTLVLAPMVASLGIPVAKMSGRGLGHTGGTIDKLQSVTGFRAEFNKEEFIQLVKKTNLAIIGQSENLTPADKKLYALRDVTATVNSIPLIASSIMSKKIAAGADAIVLDVKTGAGAFMKTLDEARELAKAMVRAGNNCGRKTLAVISDMSQPLGLAIGNALEVKEAINLLRGEGPKDLEKLCFELGKWMVCLAKKASTPEEAEKMLKEAIKSGKALAKFKEFLANQEGDTAFADYPEKLPRAAYQIELPAERTGVIAEIAANAVGKAAMVLGAGRSAKSEEIDLAAGIVLHKKIGDAVKENEPIATIHSNNENISSIAKKICESIRIAPNAQPPPLIYEVITE